MFYARKYNEKKDRRSRDANRCCIVTVGELEDKLKNKEEKTE